MRLFLAVLFLIFCQMISYSQDLQVIAEASDYFDVEKYKPYSKGLKKLKFRVFHGKYLYYTRDSYERLNLNDPLTYSVQSNNEVIDALSTLKTVSRESVDFKNALLKVLDFKTSVKYFKGYVYQDKNQKKFMIQKAASELERNGTLAELSELYNQILSQGLAYGKVKKIPSYDFTQGQFLLDVVFTNHKSQKYAFVTDADQAEKLIDDKKYLAIVYGDHGGGKVYHLFSSRFKPPNDAFCTFSSSD